MGGKPREAHVRGFDSRSLGQRFPRRSPEQTCAYARWGDTKPIEFYGTRPGGSNRQERAHQVGAPESLTEAIKEIGMVQVHTCVSVHCDQCGDSLGSPAFEEHFATEDAALDAAAAEGWLIGPGGRLWCSACGPVLTCEAVGHEFSPWRYCRRCCLEESRPVEWLLIFSGSRQGKSAGVARLIAAGTDGAGEVA